MTAVAQQTLPETTEATAEQTRRCIVTGNLLPKEKLVRYVLDPEGRVVPDLAGNLPGRGLWVTASRADVATAVQKNLFAKAAHEPAKASQDLPDMTAQLLRKRILDFIGLSRSAGTATLGQPQVEAALKARCVTLLFLADDAGAELGYSKDIATCRTLSRAELGAALGYEQIVYVGFAAHGLTEKLAVEVERLAGFNADTTTQTNQNG
ncbi:MAG: DUF448 domain-containing protein [Alphaproteobacteria bacterium]|nr:DUF448 domain-containing protein [Alphaproteobacteria bacterium]MBV8548221.1 DUF448 domain-containing protein [Alphaproteobacteria bacterium]